MKRLMIISAIFLLIISCSEESTTFDPTYFGDGFKGITFTNEDGPDPLKADLTDWCTTYSTRLPKTNNSNGISHEEPIPTGFIFGAAFPNPINKNSSTTIPFTLPHSTEVFIYVINKDYRIIAVLVNDIFESGTYEVEFDTERIGVTGIYRVVFETENIYCKGDIWVK